MADPRLSSSGLSGLGLGLAHNRGPCAELTLVPKSSLLDLLP